MSAAVAPSVAVPQQQSSHPFTCNTCQVAFRGSELQRSHMQSDWHRYNLKRRVASLPPLTSETFAQKVIANQASAAATAAKASFEKVCAACQRTYFSENAYQNHLQSQKHRLRLAQLESAQGTLTEDDVNSVMSSTFSLGEPLDTASEIEDPAAEAEFSRVVNGMKETKLDDDEDPVVRRPTRPHHSSNEDKQSDVLSVDADGETVSTSTATPTVAASSIADPTPTLSCLFCNKQSESLELNVKHMESMHSMFIPERAYLVDLEGLVKYLNDRVYGLHECLYCGQIRHTTMGVKTHMRDKGHCRIAFEAEDDMLEVGEFYDFRSTYSDGEEDEEDSADVDVDEPNAKNGVRLGAKRSSAYVNEEGMEVDEAADDDEEWESDEDMSDVETPNGRPTARRSAAAYIDENELHLPSGRTAGHRSQAHIYRQNLRDYPTPAERASRLALTDGEAPSEGSNAQGQRGRQLVSRADGGLGMVGVTTERKKEVQKMEMKEKKKEQRAQARYQWGNERRANFQKHYRDPLLQ